MWVGSGYALATLVRSQDRADLAASHHPNPQLGRRVRQGRIAGAQRRRKIERGQRRGDGLSRGGSIVTMSARLIHHVCSG
jgi:hypothetical protein